MANKKINELQSRVPSLTDLMLVGDPSSGYSYKCTVSELATIIETDISDNFVTLTTTQSISGAKTFSNILTLTSVANATSDPDKFLVLNASNVVNYRTGSEVLSDIGGQGALTLTTTGTSGAATLVGNTLNIPQYQSVLTNPVTGTGTTNYLAKFTATSTIGNSIVFDNGTNVGIGGSSPAYKLDVTGDIRSTIGAYFATSSGNIGIGTTSPTGSGGPILHIKAGSIPEIHLTNSTTGDAYNDGFSLNVNGLNTYFTNYENGFLSFYTNNTERVRIAADGNVTFSQIANATTDTDRFLVSDSGVIKYRTGSELLSDIGGQAALTNPVTGTGTTNYIPKFTGTSAIENSVIYEASGNVGIGTTSPIAFTGYTSVAANGTSGGAFVTMANGTSALRVISSTTDAAIWEPRNSPILFGVNNAEQMRLTSTGLGIGTSSPAYELEVVRAANPRIGITGTNSTGVPELYMRRNSTTVVGYLGAGVNSDLTNVGDFVILENRLSTGGLGFRTNGTTRAILDASGNLGLGVTPSAWTTSFGVKVIDIGSKGSFYSSDNDANISFNQYFDGTNTIYKTTGTASRFALVGNEFQWRQAPSGTAGNAISFTQAMTLTADGNLLIGSTTNNGNRLETTGIANNWAFSAWGSTTTGQSYGGIVRGGTNSSDIAFSVNNAANSVTYLRVRGDGNVGIGTTSPAAKLELNSSSGNTQLLITSTSGTYPYISLAQTGVATWSLQNVATSGLFTITEAGVADRLVITKTSGNVGIGTTSPGNRLHVYSTGPELLRLEYSGATGGNYIQFKNSSGDIGYFGYGSTGSDQMTIFQGKNSDLAIFTNSSERMRIKSGGVINLSNVPSSATGLATGDIYRDGDGYLLIVL